MPSFTRELEQTLHNALAEATRRRHEYATLEHLLIALVDDEHASKVMTSCGVNRDELRASVKQYLDHELGALVENAPGAERIVPDLAVADVVVTRESDRGAMGRQRRIQAGRCERGQIGCFCEGHSVAEARGADSDSVHDHTEDSMHDLLASFPGESA